jgi:hypothetical protein
VEQSIGNNAARLIGELFLPGASHYVSGNIGSGLIHSVLAGAAGAALIGSGVAPLVGTLAVVGVKLNSYSSATTGRGLFNLGADAVQRASSRFGAARSTSPATTTTGPTGEAV